MFFGTYIFAEKHIFFVRPLLEYGVYEKVPRAHACALYTRYPIVARALGLAAAECVARAKVSCIQAWHVRACHV